MGPATVKFYSPWYFSDEQNQNMPQKISLIKNTHTMHMIWYIYSVLKQDCTVLSRQLWIGAFDMLANTLLLLRIKNKS